MSVTGLVEEVGAALRELGAMVAVAESATGGLLGSTLTDVPGSSDYFDRGAITYSNAAKVEMIGVDSQTLDTQGAVSEQTAREMAIGISEHAGTSWGVSTTGVAGPGGGTPENPVGTVYIGVARNTDGEASIVTVERHEVDGSRGECKREFARRAISDLRKAVEGAVDDQQLEER